MSSPIFWIRFLALVVLALTCVEIWPTESEEVSPERILEKCLAWYGPTGDQAVQECRVEMSRRAAERSNPIRHE